MPWKRQSSAGGLTARQAAAVLLASMLTGLLACWIGSGTQAFYGKVSSRFSGAPQPPPGTAALLEKYRAGR